MYRRSEIIWQKRGEEKLRCWMCGTEFVRVIRPGGKPACPECRKGMAPSKWGARRIVSGSHGGKRPIVDDEDGRLVPKRIIETQGPSHHLLAPGAWMPFARSEVEDDPVLPVPTWTMGHPSPDFGDEDLMPYELRWVRERRAFRDSERRRLLGS